MVGAEELGWPGRPKREAGLWPSTCPAGFDGPPREGVAVTPRSASSSSAHLKNLHRLGSSRPRGQV